MEPKRRLTASELLRLDWFKKEFPQGETPQLPEEVRKEYISNMEEYNKASPYMKLMIGYIAHSYISNADANAARELFKHMDSSNDGKISKSEI